MWGKVQSSKFRKFYHGNTLYKAIHVERNDTCPTVIPRICTCVKVLIGWKLIFGYKVQLQQIHGTVERFSINQNPGYISFHGMTVGHISFRWTCIALHSVGKQTLKQLTSDTCCKWEFLAKFLSFVFFFFSYKGKHFCQSVIYNIIDYCFSLKKMTKLFFTDFFLFFTHAF